MKSPADVAVSTPTETLIRPVVAPSGTTAVSELAEAAATSASAAPNRTVLPAGCGSKPAPWMVTAVPAAPDVGEKEEMLGAPTAEQDAAQAASAATAARRAVLMAGSRKNEGAPASPRSGGASPTVPTCSDRYQERGGGGVFGSRPGHAPFRAARLPGNSGGWDESGQCPHR